MTCVTVCSDVALAVSLREGLAMILASFAVVTADLIVEECRVLDAVVRRFKASTVHAWMSRYVR